MNENIEIERYFGRTLDLSNHEGIVSSPTIKRPFNVILASLFLYFLFGFIGIASNAWIFFLISYTMTIPLIIVMIPFVKNIINHEKSSYRELNEATCKRYGLEESDLNNWWNGLSKFGKVSSFTVDGRELEALWTLEDDLMTPLLIEITATKVPSATKNHKPNSMVSNDEEFTKVFNKNE